MDLNSSENRKRGLLLLVFLTIMTIVRIGWFVKVPYYHEQGSGYDDVYLMNMADSIRWSGWLGDYSYVTLIKGASFPLFLAISNLLCMPYPLALGIFHVAAAAVFSAAVKRISRSNLFTAVSYLWLLYSPASFGLNAVRVYRNAILYPAILLVIGCLLMVYLNRGQKIRRQLLWLILLGFSFAFFYYIREDSIWLLPLFLGGLLICAIWRIWFSGEPRKKAAVLSLVFLIPAGIFLLTDMSYRLVNKKHYGVFEISDRSSGSFAKLTGNMIMVEDPRKTDKDIWLSRNQLESILDACPSLGENRETILQYYDKWAGPDGVRGDWAIWSFREALNALGYYSSGDVAENYCRKANQELLDAVKRGELTFEKTIQFSSQSRGMAWEEIPDLLKASAENMFAYSTFENIHPGVYASGDRNEETRWMEGLAGVQTVSRMGKYAHLAGWMFLKDNDLGDVWIRIIDQNGNLLADREKLKQRGDVHAAYPDYTHSEKSGFSLWLDASADMSSSTIQVYLAEDDSLVKECSPIRDYEDDELKIYIDSFSVEYHDPYALYMEKYDNMVKKLTDAFRIVGKAVMILALLMTVLSWALFFIRRKWDRFEPAIILTGFLLSAYILEFGVTTYSLWLHTEWFYSIGVTAVGQAIQVAAGAWLLKYMREWREYGRKTGNENISCDTGV